MADVECAIALDTNNAPAYLGRGLVYKARNQNAEALEDFNKAIALAPDNSEAYYNRGLLHQDEKQYQSAIGDFTAASGLVPRQADVRRATLRSTSRRKRLPRRGGAG
jgi:tetratricopeptide (TPR) repeat protein